MGRTHNTSSISSSIEACLDAGNTSSSTTSASVEACLEAGSKTAAEPGESEATVPTPPRFSFFLFVAAAVEMVVVVAVVVSAMAATDSDTPIAPTLAPAPSTAAPALVGFVFLSTLGEDIKKNKCRVIEESEVEVDLRY